MKRTFKKLFAAMLAVVLVTGVIPELGYRNVHATGPARYEMVAQSAPTKDGYVKPANAPEWLTITPEEGGPDYPTEGQPFKFKLSGVPEGYEIDTAASIVSRVYSDYRAPLGDPVDGFYTIPSEAITGNLIIDVMYKVIKHADPEPSWTEPSEADPIQNAATGGTWNLFYTTYYGQSAMKIDLPEGADPSKGAGKWTNYFKVSDKGEVTVIPQEAKERKSAAKPTNSLISIPIFSGSEQTGEFVYQLPVCYKEPELRLSSKAGSIRKDVNEIQTLKTNVTIKRASGFYESLDLSAQRTDIGFYDSKNGSTAAIYTGEDSKTGDVIIQATQKGNVMLHIQLADWCTEIKLKYRVKVSSKDVFTYSVDGEDYQEGNTVRVILNNNATTPGKDHVIKLRINGKPAQLKESDIVRAKDDDRNNFIFGADGDTITIKYPENPASMVKGYYTYEIKSDKVTFTVKVDVSNKPLSGALKFSKGGDIDLTIGQKITYKIKYQGITGPVEKVSVDDKNFSVTYDEGSGYVFLGKEENGTLTDDKYSPTITVTVGGIDCPIKVSSVKPKYSIPTVTTNKLEFSKTNVQNGTAEGVVNLTATVTKGKIAYTVNPTKVVFDEGKEDGGDGWYLISKSKLRVKYDSEKRVILVNALAQPDKINKMPSVKISVFFEGRATGMKKSFSIKVK